MPLDWLVTSRSSDSPTNRTIPPEPHAQEFRRQLGPPSPGTPLPLIDATYLPTNWWFVGERSCAGRFGGHGRPEAGGWAGGRVARRFSIERGKQSNSLPSSTYPIPCNGQRQGTSRPSCRTILGPTSVSVFPSHTHILRRAHTHTHTTLQGRAAAAASSKQLGDELRLRGQAVAGCGFAAGRLLQVDFD